MIDGNAIFRYKPAGAAADAAWRDVELAIPGEPYNVRRIAPMGDGRVIVATGIYGDVFLFDPKTGTYQRVGNPANRNVYCLYAKREGRRDLFRRIRQRISWRFRKRQRAAPS
jgi:hypothetical protein